MPKKIPEKSAESAARVRDNQRASRARKRELIESLQRRLSEFELRGVQASKEMQAAARVVAEENRRLRTLLAAHGVADDEIERFLRSDGPGATSLTDSVEAATSNVSWSPSGPMHRPASRASGTPASLSSGPATPTASTPVASTAPSRGLSSTGGVVTQTTCVPSDSCCRPNDASPSRQLNSEGAQQAPHPHPTQPSPAQQQSEAASCCGGKTLESAMRTDCDQAAAILAQLQGHGDRDRARESLGCPVSVKCTVKNTNVLQLFDEAS